jgi:hypothetical protein
MKIFDKLFAKREELYYYRYKSLIDIIKTAKMREKVCPSLHIIFTESCNFGECVYEMGNVLIVYSKNKNETLEMINLVYNTLKDMEYNTEKTKNSVVVKYGKNIVMGLNKPIPYHEEKDFIDQIVDTNVSTLEKDIENVSVKIDKIKTHITECAKCGYTNLNIKFSNQKPNTTLSELIENYPSNTFFYDITMTDTSSLLSVKIKVIEYFNKEKFTITDNGDEIKIDWQDKVINKLKEKGLYDNEEFEDEFI